MDARIHGRTGGHADGRTDTDELIQMRGRIADLEKQNAENQVITKQLESQKAFDADRILNLSKQLTEERQSRAQAITGRADEVASAKEERIRILTDEIEKLTSRLTDAEYKNTSVEAIITTRLEAAKKDWDKQIAIKNQEQTRLINEKMVDYENQLRMQEDTIRALKAQLKNFEELSKKWSFQLKSLWNDEMQTINIISAVMALGGFCFSLGPVGFVFALAMVLFYKNILKNLVNYLREKTVTEGMWTVIIIELIWGFFHFNTVKSAFKYFETEFLFGNIDQVTTFVVVVFTGLSIRAFYQKRNQIKDDLT
jgi:uncharacterized coiled-coil protein SlyX